TSVTQAAATGARDALSHQAASELGGPGRDRDQRSNDKVNETNTAGDDPSEHCRSEVVASLAKGEIDPATAEGERKSPGDLDDPQTDALYAAGIAGDASFKGMPGAAEAGALQKGPYNPADFPSQDFTPYDTTDLNKEVTPYSETDRPPMGLDQSLQELHKLTDGKMGKDQAGFDQNLQKFLERTDVSDEKKAETIQNLTDMLRAGDAGVTGPGQGGVEHNYLGTGAELSQNMRKVVAGAMDNAANPKGIDQADSSRCNATTVEEHMYKQDPANATAKLKEVALRATFTGDSYHNGTYAAKVPEGIFKAAIADVGGDTQSGNEVMNSASGLLTGGLINHALKPQGRAFTDTADAGKGDSGERLVDLQTGKVMGDFSGMGAYDIANMLKAGNVHDVNVISADKSFSYKGSTDGVVHVDDPSQLGNAVGKEGAILFVNSGNRLITGRDNLQGGGHVVSIYQATDSAGNPTGQFEMSDQYGSQRDRTGISGRALFNASAGRNGSADHLAASEYGVRTDGQSTAFGYNAATDRQTRDHDASKSTVPGGHRTSDAPGVFSKDQLDQLDRRQEQLHKGLPEDEDKRKPEEEPKKRADGGDTGEAGRLLSQIASLDARIQAQLDNAPGIAALLSQEADLYSRLALTQVA
ncbi:MAG: hypothetical protein KC777_07700, partial [Cyanobacteria bacterium HKST-UBA02]|nr:hypothetical protein [Cyanobacteria bacterium HKST-UBA02]